MPVLLFAPFAGTLVDRLPRVRVMVAADLLRRRPAFVFGPYVLRGVVDLVLATFTALPIALAALAAYGLGTSSGAVTFNSLLQAHTPEHARGRVFAGFDMLWQLGRLVSLLLLAAAIGWHGLRSRPRKAPPS